MNNRVGWLLFCGNLGDMAVVLITGGTGLVGKALIRSLLSKGHEVIVISRYPMDKKEKIPGLSYSRWDIRQQQIDPEGFVGQIANGADAPADLVAVEP